MLSCRLSNFAILHFPSKPKEMAKKLQEEEEEESKFRRDVRDLSKKLAIEARDRELVLKIYHFFKNRHTL